MVGIVRPPTRSGAAAASSSSSSSSSASQVDMAAFFARNPRKSISRRPQPPLCKLPAEMLLGIASFLPRSSLFCLALSCKQLWTTFSESETLPQNPQDKADILRILEKDYPSHVPCLVCMKFRRRRMTLPDQITAEYITERPLLRDHQCTESAGAVHICNNFMIAFDHVQLVLRSIKFGSGHGIPISALSHSCNKMTIGISRPHAHDHSVTPKFIDGKLMLRMQFSQTVEFAEDTFAQVKCFARHGCKHTYIDDSLAKMCESAVESAKAPAITPEATSSTDDAPPINPPRCLYCATEFDILTTNVTPTSCMLTVNCYRDLGAANSPLSEVWQSQQGVFDNEKWPLNWEAHSWTHDSLRDIFERGSSTTVVENNGEEDKEKEKEAGKKEFAVLQLLRQERLRDPEWVRFYHGS